MTAQLDQRIAQAVSAFRAALRSHRGVRAQGEVWRSLLHDDTRHTCALDGGALTEPQVVALLDHGVATRDARLTDYASAAGYAAAVRWMHAQLDGEAPRAREIAVLHDISRGAVDRLIGEFTPLPATIAAAAARAVRGLGRPLPTVSALGSAEARCHTALGGVAGHLTLTRLVVNLALIRAGCAPIVVHRRDAATYLRLVRAGEPDALGVFLTRRLLDSVHRFSLSPQPARLVSLRALATASVSADALRVAAGRGRLRAEKGADGVWRSRRGWVDDYLAARYDRLASDARLAAR